MIYPFKVVIFQSYVSLPKGNQSVVSLSDNGHIVFVAMYPGKGMDMTSYAPWCWHIYQHVPVPILDTLHKKQFLAGECR